MRFSTFGKAIIATLGIALIAAGVGTASMAASGAVQSGAVGAYIAAAAFVLVGLTVASLPFSKRLTLGFGGAVAFFIALGGLCLAFSPSLHSAQPSAVQSAAIALVVLLVARVVFILRHKRRGHDT